MYPVNLFHTAKVIIFFDMAMIFLPFGMIFYNSDINFDVKLYESIVELIVSAIETPLFYSGVHRWADRQHTNATVWAKILDKS